MTESFREIPDLLHTLLKDHCTCTMIPIFWQFNTNLEATISVYSEEPNSSTRAVVRRDGEPIGTVDEFLDKEIEIYYESKIRLQVWHWTDDDCDPDEGRKGKLSRIDPSIIFDISQALEFTQFTDYLTNLCRDKVIIIHYQGTKNEPKN